MSHNQVGRNDPCPCGSGNKYKRCCLRKDRNASRDEDDVIQSIPISDYLEETPWDDDDLETDDLVEQDLPDFPMGTMALYGPDDQTTTKVVVAVHPSPAEEPILERFVASDLETDKRLMGKINKFFASHQVTRFTATSGNIGCPHEEGLDFPIACDCPLCPFWKGKQGSGADRIASIADDPNWAEDEDDDDFFGDIIPMMLDVVPDSHKTLKDLKDYFESVDDMSDSFEVGECPACDSDQTSDCGDDPAIDDLIIARCDNCGHLWCVECGTPFRNDESASEHNCIAFGDGYHESEF